MWRTDAYRRLAEPLSGILGDKTAKALAGLGLRTVSDLMQHVPRRYLSGTETTDLGSIGPGEDVALVARVAQMETIARPGQRPRLQVVLTDGRGHLNVTFFGEPRHVKFWQLQLSKGVKGIFVGKVGEFRGELQMTHPNFVMLSETGRIVGWADEKRVAMVSHVTRGGLVGIYPATSKLPTWQIGECVDIVLDGLRGTPDPMPAPARARLDVMGLMDALEQVHHPGSLREVGAAERRLKADEALALQVTMAYRRLDASHSRALPVTVHADGLLARFDAALPFDLTEGQRQVSEQILSDIGRERPMQRLLQGEVGSGKTVVALRAMLAEVDSGRQAVLLAPTEVLASQHADSIRRMLGDLGAGRVLGAPDDATEVVLLTGSTPAARRREALAKIADGQAGIVIGTHALFSEQVGFAALGLVVVDEQHRFGVEQRAVLQERADQVPHLLVLTATPIPRSIAMTVFGDLEVSTLREIPAGRQPVQTTVVDVRAHPAWLDRAWERAREEVSAGRQVFVVCPRISGSEPDEGAGDGASPSASVTELAERLREGPLAGLRLGVLHGRLPASEKDEVMAGFAARELDVLVATTVIEVGVDVPNASMMIVMDADRFGISQLHQLRGRIGRGAYPGVCLLATAVDAGSVAAERLAAVASTRDGFELADLDLAQRREGDVLGAQQAGGKSTLRLLRVLDDAQLIADARELAEELVAGDPERSSGYLADLVTLTETRAAGEWLERS
ncbi:ATP-dependent DNA helicase RecG [Brooklawnia cerclae]